MMLSLAFCVVAMPAQAAAVAPKISSITPTQTTAGTFTLTITGSNFDSGAVDQIYWKADSHFVGQGTVQSRTSSKIVVKQLMTGTTPGAYIVKVKNSNGQISNGVTLTISAVVAPKISSYSASSTNLQVLANQAQWSTYRSSPLQELMLSGSAGNLQTNGLSKTNSPITSLVKGIGTINALKVGNGECAVFVEAISPKIYLTASWMKGKPICSVVNGKVVFDTSIPAGTIIATFTGAPGSKTYLGHCAIYGNPTSTGINVWDSNWISGRVARHCISSTTAKTSGYNYNYANDFCVVNV